MFSFTYHKARVMKTSTETLKRNQTSEITMFLFILICFLSQGKSFSFGPSRSRINPVCSLDIERRVSLPRQGRLVSRTGTSLYMAAKVPEDILKEILKLDEEIKKVNSDIERCEDEIKAAESNVLQTKGKYKQYWIEKEGALRAEENALRVKENTLRVKENTLMAEKNALRVEKKGESEVVSRVVTLSPTVIKKKLMVVNNLDLAGLKTSSEPEATLYLRNESIRMMETLKEMTTQPVWFAGCPGVGKSTTLFAYLNLPEVAARGYLWIHFSRNQFSLIRRSSNGKTHASTSSIEQSTVRHLSHLVETATDLDCIVLDGAPIDPDVIADLFYAASTRIIGPIKVVACTSHAAEDFNTESQALMGWPNFIDIDSWGLEDYKEAFRAKLPSFREKFKKINEIKEAYYYCGGSMRLMCGNVNDAETILTREFEKISDYSAVSSVLHGDRSQCSINSLMQMFSSKTIPVSEFIRRKLSSKLSDSFIATTESVNRNNPSWLGWVFEMKVLRKIRADIRSAEFFTEANGSFCSLKPWADLSVSPKVIYFDPSTSSSSAVMPNFGLISEHFNEATVDFVYLNQRGEIDVYQFARSVNHKYNFTALLPWIKLFCDENRNCTINYFVVVPYEQRHTFKITPAKIIGASSLAGYDRKWSFVYKAKNKSDNEKDIKNGDEADEDVEEADDSDEDEDSNSKLADNNSWPNKTRISLLYFEN